MQTERIMCDDRAPRQAGPTRLVHSVRRAGGIALAWYALLTTLAPAATPFAERRFAPTGDQWRLEHEPGDSATLADGDGFVSLSFDVNVEQRVPIGHQTQPEGQVRLLLKEPVLLRPEERRILFEAFGVQSMHSASLGANVQIRPYLIVSDAGGERFQFWPYPYPHLHEGDRRWSLWKTRDFRSSEAGGATQEIYWQEQDDGNARVEGDITFHGFAIRLRSSRTGRVQHTLHFGDMRTGPALLPYHDPHGYASSFFPERDVPEGRHDYRLAVTIRNAFQALPVREVIREFTYDPACLASMRQTIAFPLGPDDNYWIDYQIQGAADGTVIHADAIRAEAVGNPTPEPMATVNPAAPPVTGMMRINPEAHTTGIYGPDEPFTVTVRIFARDRTHINLEWRQLEVLFDTELGGGSDTVAFGGAPYVDYPIALQQAPGHDAYRLRIWLLDTEGETARQADWEALGADRRQRQERSRAQALAANRPVANLLDRTEYFCGRTTAFDAPYAPVTGVNRRDRSLVKEGAYFRVTFEAHGSPRDEDHLIEKFETFVRQTQPITRDFTYHVELRDFEVLEGVYNFAVLDRIMDTAAAYGCSVTIRIDHATRGGRTPLRWPKFHTQRNWDNSVAGGHQFYGSFSLADDGYLDLYFRANAAFHRRYHQHPAFQGYQLFNIGGEWAVLDQPWKGLFGGYEAPMRPAFLRYLRETLALDLEGLNARWGTAYSQWDEVTPPLPDFSTGTRPDLRMAYVDFMRFKHWMDSNYYYAQAVRKIREYDEDGVVIVYSWSPMGLDSYADYLHNGGNHYGGLYGELEPAWQDHRLGWITEPHHPQLWAAYGAPKGGGWVLDWSTWVMLGQGGGGSANLHVYFNPRHVHQDDYHLPAFFGGQPAFDRFWRFRVILHEMRQADLVQPEIGIARFADPLTLFTKHRSIFGSRWTDLRRWFERIEDDGLASENYRPEHAEQYRLIMPNILDEVMSLDNIETLAGLIRDGRKAIIGANVGRYCPEQPENEYVLLRALGIDPPQGDYVQGGIDVEARVTTANPLFREGERIRFFTFDELRRSYRELDFGDEGYMRWPYCWIPMTDYFGHYRDNRTTNGEVLARFADGGVALSHHTVGTGEVMVFWGTPDYQQRYIGGMMSRAAAWAGVPDPRQGNPIARMWEMKSSHTSAHASQPVERYYAVLYEDTPGTYLQRLPSIPDGNWFLDELVSDRKLGYYRGQELREDGVPLDFLPGASPLQIIRLSPDNVHWGHRYRNQTDPRREWRRPAAARNAP